jgi:hypothetical protein
MKIYTADQLAYLREGYKLMDLASLTIEFNREYKLAKSPTQIKATLSNHKITCGRSTGSINSVPKLLTGAQAAFVNELYKHIPLADVTRELNAWAGTKLTTQQITTFVKNHGIKSGRTGCFEKGNKAWNDGIKGSIKPNITSFKKGQIPKNIKPFGHERVCSKDNYILIKVDEINPNTGFRGHYRHKHVVLWENKHGPVPIGHVVTFKNGDKRDFSNENLTLVTRNALCRYNKKRTYDLPKELIPTMKSIVDLETKIAHKKKTLNTKITTAA